MRYMVQVTAKMEGTWTGLAQPMFRLTDLSPELLEVLLGHLTYEEARFFLKPSCKKLLALFAPGAAAEKTAEKTAQKTAEKTAEKTVVKIAWQPATPHFELRKTLRRIESRWGFHSESRKLEAMARLLHKLHGRGVVRLEQDPVGQYLLDYTSAETDLRSLRCIFGFHVLQVLDFDAWFAACIRFVVDNDMLRFGGFEPYVQVRSMLQTLGLTGALDVRMHSGEVIESRWRFGDRGYYSNTGAHRALMRAVDAAREDAARQDAAERARAERSPATEHAL
jgi:hypothetical protein